MQYDGKQLKRNAKKLLSENFWAVAAVLAISLVTAYVLSFLEGLLMGTAISVPASLLIICLTTVITAPIVVGMYMAYRRIIDGGEKYHASELFEWVGDIGKLWLAVKSFAYFMWICMVWAMVYFVLPIMLTYTIWGNSLVSADQERTAMTMLIVLAGVFVLAIGPFITHIVRYYGGLYLTVEDSHLTVRHRFEVGREIFRGNVFKYLALMLSFLPWILVTFVPMTYFMSDYILHNVISYKVLLSLPFYLAFQFYVVPYMGITSMEMFDVMRAGKKRGTGEK